MLNGRCLCGAVGYVVDDAFSYAFYCHCSKCRRRSGSAFAAIGGIERGMLEVTHGHEDLVKYGESDNGYECLCSRCFALLYALVRERRFAHVQLGTLSDVPSQRPTHHIHVASKAAWYEITDRLPQFDELPP